MKTTVKELIDVCTSRFGLDCIDCPFYEYKCYEPTYPSIPRYAKTNRKFNIEKALNKEVELKLDK